MLGRSMNAALRFATGTKKYDHITPAYKNLGLMKIPVRRNYLCISFLAKILRERRPRYLFDSFCYRDMEKVGSKRRPDLDLVINSARTDCKKIFFVITAARLWNDLPIFLRLLYKKKSFKHLLKQYCLDTAFVNS